MSLTHPFYLSSCSAVATFLQHSPTSGQPETRKETWYRWCLTDDARFKSFARKSISFKNIGRKTSDLQNTICYLSGDSRRQCTGSWLLSLEPAQYPRRNSRSIETTVHLHVPTDPAQLCRRRGNNVQPWLAWGSFVSSVFGLCVVVVRGKKLLLDRRRTQRWHRLEYDAAAVAADSVGGGRTWKMKRRVPVSFRSLGYQSLEESSAIELQNR